MKFSNTNPKQNAMEIAGDITDLNFVVGAELAKVTSRLRHHEDK
jgi:hypothetical protein